MQWTPIRTLAETEALLCAPGELHEVETRFIEGRLQRVYKNLWPSLRAFWLWAVEQHAEKTYMVFEQQRLTYRQMNVQVLSTASLFYYEYKIRKGDRVAICSRNCVEFLVAFWACQLIGAVSVMVNAWLPLEPLQHCLVHTECKLIIVDGERADKLQIVVDKLFDEYHIIGMLVLLDNKHQWRRMKAFDHVMQHYSGPSLDTRYEEMAIEPEDNAAIMFTSGTTGLPKGVLSTQRQFLTNVLNTLVGPRRAALRRGENPSEPPPEGPQKAALLAVPLFHVTGLTSYTMMATMTGLKIVLMRKWIPEEGRLIRAENVAVAGGVPAMVSDLLESSLVGYPLEGLFFGGSAAPEILAAKAVAAFPTARLSQGYGMTETNSVAVGIAGEDQMMRPASTGLACPVNDMMIVVGDRVASCGEVGEVYLRGPNVMRGYYRDPDATSKVITADGWLKTGDIGMLDQEGFLYVKDRIKDIIIRGGENIASLAVENALYTDSRLLEVAAVGIPDKRLGELVAAVVSVKPAYKGQVTEESLIEVARKNLPKFAVPVMIVIREEPFELTPSGKIMKGQLRKLAEQHWKDRQRISGRVPRANL